MFIYEGRGKGQRTEHEKKAMRNIKQAFNWIVGGYYNSIEDGYPEDLPNSREDLAEEIYSESMNSTYGPGVALYGLKQKEIRFATEKFCRAYIEYLLSTDGDAEYVLSNMQA